MCFVNYYESLDVKYNTQLKSFMDVSYFISVIMV